MKTVCHILLLIILSIPVFIKAYKQKYFISIQGSAELI